MTDTQVTTPASSDVGTVVWGVVRTLLAAGGGWFVAKGYFDSDTLNTILGAGGTLFVAIWSVVAKLRSKAA